MDPAERLADYLAGELDADERAALEAELARDTGLRAQLEMIRAADAALTHLRSPEPPAGFEARLRERLAPALAAELASPPAGQLATEHPHAEHRTVVRPMRRRWMPAAIGVAAAGLLVLGGVGVVLSGGFGSGDDSADVVASGDAAESADDGAAVFEAAPEAAEEAPAEERASDPLGPVLTVSDRALTVEDVDALLDVPELVELATRGLGPDEGGSLAAAWDAGLAAFVTDAASGTTAQDVPPQDDQDAPAADEQDAETPDAGAPALPAAEVVQTGDRDPRPEELEALGRCLAVLLEDAPDAIATYVELADLDRTPAVVVGLVTIDPATGRYTRAEVWALDRSTCAVLRFVQR